MAYHCQENTYPQSQKQTHAIIQHLHFLFRTFIGKSSYSTGLLKFVFANVNLPTTQKREQMGHWPLQAGSVQVPWNSRYWRVTADFLLNFFVIGVAVTVVKP